MDSARQPRVQRNPAQPFEVIGTNGGANQLPVVQPINVPSVQIPDRAAEYLSRGEQIVDQSFSYSQTTVDSEARARQAEAQNPQRSGFAGVFADLATGVQKGLEAYGEYKQAEAEQERLIAEARAEQAALAQQRLDSSLGAELENDVRAKLVELQEAFIQNGTDNGSVTTFFEFINETRSLYLQRGVSPEVVQEIINIGYDSLSEVQKGFGSRIQEQSTALRNELVEQNTNALYSSVFPDIARLINNPSATNGMADVVNIVNGRINEFLSGSDLGTLERLIVINDIHERVAGQLETAQLEYYEFTEQQNVLKNVLNRAQALQLQYGNNPEMLGAEFLMLEQELRQVGIDVTLSDTYANDVVKFGEQLDLEERLARLAEAQSSQPRELSAEDQRQVDVLNSRTAWNWINNPNDPSNIRAMTRAGTSEATLSEEAALATYNRFTESRQRYLDITRSSIPQLQTRRQAAFADIELLRDKVDSEGRLGPPTFTDEYLRAIVELAGSERDTLSREAAEALGNLENTRIFEIDSELNRLQNEAETLIRQWIPNGFNLENPADSTYIDQLTAAAEEYLSQRNAELVANPPAPTTSSGIPLEPSTFQQGLPLLPAR